MRPIAERHLHSRVTRQVAQRRKLADTDEGPRPDSTVEALAKLARVVMLPVREGNAPNAAEAYREALAEWPDAAIVTHLAEVVEDAVTFKNDLGRAVVGSHVPGVEAGGGDHLLVRDADHDIVALELHALGGDGVDRGTDRRQICREVGAQLGRARGLLQQRRQRVGLELREHAQLHVGQRAHGERDPLRDEAVHELRPIDGEPQGDAPATGLGFDREWPRPERSEPRQDRSEPRPERSEARSERPAPRRREEPVHVNGSGESGIALEVLPPAKYTILPNTAGCYTADDAVRTLRLARELGITTIHVTHDREEAMVMADRIVILNAGRIEQQGPPEEVYNRPETPFVAKFMGAENAIELPARVSADRIEIPAGPNNCAQWLPAPVPGR